ncbi:type II secretion system protein N [Psychromonas ingrahamii 37]|uniref:Type II secretion system protein N n=1 Tax=Psychromonas ingrahamii (strain DSM 17664 / CCUG 51855 / 37) TaxID=357804 RepID=A1SR66_PSYIN|nr:type II secretion system protein N [Psychromonas ingrahamii]ABM01981.1 type II secretion system protein N [Psychromonas ingrahamii 37]
MKIKFIIFFVSFYLVALLATLPATALLRFIPQNTGLQIAGVSGSAWQGEAALLSYNKKLNLQRVSWDVDWFALAALQIKLNVKFNNGQNAMSGKGFVKLGLSGLAIENVLLDLSAQELLSYADLPIPVEASGDITLVIKEASQGEPYCDTLDGFFVWKNAGINSDLGKIDLTTMNINLSCDKGNAVAILQQESEQLSSNINILLQQGGAYRLVGTVKGSNKLSPDINQALSFLGPKDASGATVVRFNGRL